MDSQNAGSRLLGGAIGAIALCLAAALPAAAQNQNSNSGLIERANRGLVYIATSSSMGTSIRAVEDIADVLDDGATRRIVAITGKGSVQNLMDLKVLRGIDVTIVQQDVLDFAKQQRNPPGIDAVTYITKLWNEEFHLLARSEVKSAADLAGKRVNFGVSGDGTPLTATRIFDMLKIRVVPTSFAPAVALEKLRTGEIAALAFVAAKPAPLFQQIRGQEGLHLISVPLKSGLAAAYLPTRFTAEDYPGLVAADAPVDTIAVGSVLLAANLIQDSDRYRNVANFVDALFTQFPKLLEPGHHAKWNEVNLAADLPGWRRFGPADTWLKRNGGAAAPVSMNEQQLRDIFSKFLEERGRASGQALTAQQKDDLFDQFKRWQEGKVR